jgi:hypothetical protein
MDTVGMVWLGTLENHGRRAAAGLGWCHRTLPYLIDHKLDSGTNTFASMVLAEYLEGA